MDTKLCAIECWDLEGRLHRIRVWLTAPPDLLERALHQAAGYAVQHLREHGSFPSATAIAQFACGVDNLRNRDLFSQILQNAPRIFGDAIVQIDQIDPPRQERERVSVNWQKEGF